MNLEEEIITKASETLKNSFNFQIGTTDAVKNERDSLIEIKFKQNEKNIIKIYSPEIYGKTHSSIIGQLVLKQKQVSNKIILITEYVPPKFAEKLRELDISFFDANGNVYFNEPEFYIFVNSHGRKTELRKTNAGLIFQPSGLQMLFVLLSIPNSENKTYRELSELSGISLGAVSEAMNTLQAENYLVKEREKRILFRKDELIKRWVQGFSETLCPRLSELQFESEDIDWWEKADLTATTACWSGEVAADKMTDYLHPIKTIIYVKHSYQYLTKKYKLIRVRNGNIKIRARFWNFNENDIIAPPLLVYADLLATAESRNIEAAQIIYDEHLAGLIE